MKSGKVCYSELCMLGWPDYTPYKDGKWSVNEVNVNTLYCAVANAGATWQRIMPWSVWSPHPEVMKSQFSPYVLAGEKFDLTKWNDYYFSIVRQVIGLAKKYGIKTWFCLADHCQFHGTYRQWSPWVSNVNGVSTLYEDKAQPYFSQWIKKCLDEFAGMGVAYTWGNEMNSQYFRELANKVIFPFMKSGQLTPSECAYGTTMEMGEYNAETKEYTGGAGLQDFIKKDVGAVFGDKVKLEIWREVHGCGGKGYPAPPNPMDNALYWWGNHPIKTWLSDDGVWDGESPCDFEQDTGRRRPSALRWSQMVKLAKSYKNNFVFEHLPKGGNLECQVNTVKEIYKGVYGKYPEKKYSYTPPVEPPSPPPEPPPQPTVVVKVCTLSGEVAGEWCPQSEEKTFVSGTEPVQYCQTHYKPCKYFLATGNILHWLRCVLFGKH